MMARPIRSFTERLASQEKTDALATMTTTECLLAHILIELMNTRQRRDPAALSKRLRMAGLSMKQIAALLDTTPASLAVARRRSASKPAVGAVDPQGGISNA